MQPPPASGRRAARKEDRRRAILDIADRSFFERGYAATSMSAIAAELGGSKTTLWSYFPSKEALFAAVMDSKLVHFAVALDEALIPAGGTRGALKRFGRIFLAKILSDDSCALRRLIGAEGQRFPEMASTFYEHGPGRVRERLTRYMREEMAGGRLRNGDPLIAARQFLALCQAGAFADATWHRPADGGADPERDVRQAVDTFLRAWRPLSPASPPACSAEA